MSKSGERGIRSILNATKIMEAFGSDEAVGVSELARRVKLHKATVQRVLTTLFSAGWIEPTADTQKRWAPSMQLLVISSRFHRGRTLRTVAVPHMHRLRDSTRESVVLVVPHALNVVSVDRLESPLPIRASAPIGRPVPIHASSGGKAILARLPPDTVEKILTDRKLDAVTRKTIVGRRELIRDLETIRRRGYAVAWQESRSEVVGVGAAITNAFGHPVAAISVSAPVMRTSADRAAYIGGLVAKAAAQISTDIRHLSDPLA